MDKQLKPTLQGVQDAADNLGISPWTLRGFAYSGKISSVKIGTRLMFKSQDIDAFIEANTRPALR